MKRDIELQKPVAHTSIWLGKKESDFCFEMYGAQKGQRLILNVDISKISSIDLKQRCIILNGSNVMIYSEAKWKASKLGNQFVGGHIYSFL